jgi:hypothetical protein
MMGMHRRFNDGENDRDDRFRHFHNRTFIFFDTFGFPFFYPYPYYGTIRTITTVTTITDTAMETRLWKYSAGLLALVTIVDRSMESWDLKRGGQFALTNASTTCPPTA